MTIPVASPDHSDDATFRLAIWVGTLGGAALPVDDDPNTTPPQASRILKRYPPETGVSMGGALLRATIADGTALTWRPWFYDDSQAKWIPWGTSQNLSNTANISGGGQFTGNMIGAKIFCQITANSGGTTFFGYDFR